MVSWRTIGVGYDYRLCYDLLGYLDLPLPTF